MKTNISLYMKVYIVLYDTMYNENGCCHYIRRCKMATKIS